MWSKVNRTKQVIFVKKPLKSTSQQVKNELESQRIATQFALRKRSHQLEQADQELQWQIKTVICLYQCLSHPCPTVMFNSQRFVLSNRLRMK